VLYNGTFWPMAIIDELFPGIFVDHEISALMHRIHAAVFKQVSGLPAAELEAQSMPFPNLGRMFVGLSFTRLIAPLMIGFLATVLFPIICWALVSEKSSKLREVMVMSGLQRTPYWVINYMHFYTLYLFQMVVMFLACFLLPRLGAASIAEPGKMGFKLFTNHDPAILVILFVLYGFAHTSFAFFFSTLVNGKYISIIIPVFVVEICGITSYILTDNAIQVDANGAADLTIAGLMPMYALTNAIQILVAATGDAQGANGVRLTLGSLDGIYSPVATAMKMLVVDIALYTSLFIYCDMVLPVGPGVKRHPLFFLQKSFWSPSSMKLDVKECTKPPEQGEGADVTAERERCAAAAAAANDQVRCLGLRKLYPGAERPAVVNVQFGIGGHECFGLLGSNGAGKSTTIHILCGLHAPTEGTVVVKTPTGPALDTRKDLGTIQSAMGVCPQDNLLWDDLTGDEHLQFFGRLRGLKEGKKFLKRHIAYWLKAVNLATRSTKPKPSRAYSGGMKRRLSVACAFIANPRLVYLDEPSTGLDPESRRQLWRAIRVAKRDKSIILTTHALEEADALCDRIGIMTFGQMRVVGAPNELRMRFDQGYKLMLAAAVEQQSATDSLVMGLAPDALLRDAINGVRTYVVPKATAVGALFEAIEAKKGELGIQDWGLSQTSLEEVFLEIVAATSNGAEQSASKSKGEAAGVTTTTM